MIQRFLKAKHWQLFLLTFGLPFIAQLISFMFMFNNRDNASAFAAFGLFGVVMILFCAVLYGWLWSIAIGLQTAIPENIRLNIKRFKIFFLFPIVYFFVFILFAISMFGPNMNPSIFAVIIPLHVFAMFCMFYNLYFVAKTIKTAELQKKVSFGDFAGEFFLIWFYPVGIWFVQPKINEIAKNSELNSEIY